MVPKPRLSCYLCNHLEKIKQKVFQITQDSDSKIVESDVARYAPVVYSIYNGASKWPIYNSSLSVMTSVNETVLLSDTIAENTNGDNWFALDFSNGMLALYVYPLENYWNMLKWAKAFDVKWSCERIIEHFCFVLSLNQYPDNAAFLSFDANKFEQFVEEISELNPNCLDNLRKLSTRIYLK